MSYLSCMLVCVCVYLCMCMHALRYECAHVHPVVCMWQLEDNLRCQSSPLMSGSLFLTLYMPSWCELLWPLPPTSSAALGLQLHCTLLSFTFALGIQNQVPLLLSPLPCPLIMLQVNPLLSWLLSAGLSSCHFIYADLVMWLFLKESTLTQSQRTVLPSICIHW